MVGIKGTGMTALADLLHTHGANVSGSDTTEQFYTDEILATLGITVIESFDAAALPTATDALIHSAAYNRADHPQLVAAANRRIPILSYTEALGALSKEVFSIGVSGVHGKTTIAAMIGTMARALSLPATILVGSAVIDFDGRSMWSGGDRFLIAETCEYRRHFLDFHPNVIVVATVESDHTDYFVDRDDIIEAFVEYGMRLPLGGILIYCADDDGACEVHKRVIAHRPDVIGMQYGFSAEGRYTISQLNTYYGMHSFRLNEYAYAHHTENSSDDGWELPVPGRHAVLNAVGAIAVIDHLLNMTNLMTSSAHGIMRRALKTFAGCRRRCEIVGMHNNILIIDDYGHHPTAIRATLAGLHQFYPDRRIIVDFMSHTYSRTADMLLDFATAFRVAAIVIVHKIYASAREHFEGSIEGVDLANAIGKHHHDVRYYAEPLDALDDCIREVTPGDLFITMGAGDNWRLGQQLLGALRSCQDISA